MRMKVRSHENYASMRTLRYHFTMDSRALLVFLVFIFNFCSLLPLKRASEIKKRKSFETKLRQEGFEDAFLTTIELIAKYGYPVENHTVVTDDGYILELHRIPRPGATPVLFFHGFGESSASAVVMGPEKGIGYILFDEGYDVWIGNARGSRYSKKHLTISTKSQLYWEFSFHEMGVYDLPAFFDYIIKTTGYEKLHYIGYSQASTAFWIMCSEREGYCDKVIMTNALAPVAYLSRTKSPALTVIAPLARGSEIILSLTGDREFLPNRESNVFVSRFLCVKPGITQSLCSTYIAIIGGFNKEQFNMTSLPVLAGHLPAGVSTKTFIHFTQFINSGKFRQFDYGVVKNLWKYRKLQPPRYNLKKTTAPVALYYGLGDVLSVPVDVIKLFTQLPNVKKMHVVKDPKFCHTDFMYAIDVKRLLYDEVIATMREEERKISKA